MLGVKIGTVKCYYHGNLYIVRKFYDAMPRHFSHNIVVQTRPAGLGSASTFRSTQWTKFLLHHNAPSEAQFDALLFSNRFNPNFIAGASIELKRHHSLSDTLPC